MQVNTAITMMRGMTRNRAGQNRSNCECRLTQINPSCMTAPDEWCRRAKARQYPGNGKDD
jgi:hypothetical protein